jgi:hypothetical protein
VTDYPNHDDGVVPHRYWSDVKSMYHMGIGVDTKRVTFQPRTGGSIITISIPIRGSLIYPTPPIPVTIPVVHSSTIDIFV